MFCPMVLHPVCKTLNNNKTKTNIVRLSGTLTLYYKLSGLTYKFKSMVKRLEGFYLSTLSGIFLTVTGSYGMTSQQDY